MKKQQIDQNKVFLHYKNKTLEAEFKNFYELETRIYIRIGIIFSILAWASAILLTYYIVPGKFVLVATVILISTYPFFSFIVYATYNDRFVGYYQLMASIANGIAGILIIFFFHHVGGNYAEHLILLGLLIIIFFAFYVLRLRMLHAFIISIGYMGAYQVYLLQFGSLVTNQFVILTHLTWMVEFFAILSCYISESIFRKIFLQQKTIHEQQAKIQKAYSLLSKYVAPQLADTIADGQIDSIWKHHRKKLTLFFSDIKDFTTITDSLEPEDMANVLNEYLSEMNTIINKYKGTLAQVIGDGLYIIFGAPESTNDKDHALRCVKMAIDMQQKMNDLNKNWFKQGIDELLQIRCGINTGMATVGGYGSSERKEYTAMGMQTNIAARLEQTCTPSEILISHTTWALVNDKIPCSEHGKINVKGLNRPIRAYRVDVTADAESNGA